MVSDVGSESRFAETVMECVVFVEIVHNCSTDGTQHKRKYPVAPAPMPGSPI